jgi:hypothetical protein
VIVELERATDVMDSAAHTLVELYDHRRALSRALMLLRPEVSWRSRAHHPTDEAIDVDRFVVGMDLPTGQITYHYRLEDWSDFDGVVERDHAPKWDGHSREDVVERLLAWVPTVDPRDPARPHSQRHAPRGQLPEGPC